MRWLHLAWSTPVTSGAPTQTTGTTVPSTISLFERVRHAGCWAIGLYAFALFFAFGALASLFNGDLLTTVWGIVLAALAAGLGIWLARKANRK